MPLESKDVHPQGTNALSDRATNIAITDDPDGLPRDHFDIKWLPSSRHLVTNHAAKVFGEIQDRAECKFTERSAEYSFAIGEDDIAGDQFREQHSLQTDRTRMHPP